MTLCVATPDLRHGSPDRKTYCGCMVCRYDRPFHSLRWPLQPLIDHVGYDSVRCRFDARTWTNYRANGIPDLDLDDLCITLGVHPGQLYDGYFEAGLDGRFERT